MSTELDTAAATQLSVDIRNLTITVTKLEMSISQFGPVLQSQVSGLADCVNRVTRIEDRYATLRQQVIDEKAERDARDELMRKDTEARNAQNRFLIGTTLTIITISLGFLYWIAQHVTFK